jgi:hypothetical protein
VNKVEAVAPLESTRVVAVNAWAVKSCHAANTVARTTAGVQRLMLVLASSTTGDGRIVYR